MAGAYSSASLRTGAVVRRSSPTVNEGSQFECNHTNEPSLTVGLLHRVTYLRLLVNVIHDASFIVSK